MPHPIITRIVLALAAALAFASVSLTQAQELPPRPTAIPTVAPTKERPTAIPTGRITGTVIDQTSGAPAPGIAVRVGDTVTISDANGNYDRNALAAGTYEVALLLTAEQGETAQAPVKIELAADATAIQHLFFRGPVTAVPAQAEPVPAALPATGAKDQARWLILLALLLAVGGWLTRRVLTEPKPRTLS